MTNSPSPDLSGKSVPETLNFRFEKASDFRAIQADGAWFSLGPQAQVHMTFFTDSFPLPTELQVKVDPKSGAAIPQNPPPASNMVDRQLLIDVVMTPQAAKHFYQLLGGNLSMNPLVKDQ